MPIFKELKLTDKEELENIIKSFPPYSDFNFVSLWSYNIENDITFSFLNNNLVLKFRDYITNEFFYTFLGTDKISDTITTLLKLTNELKAGSKLKLVPEISIVNNQELFSKFLIQEDRDNFDYIYSLEKMSELLGAGYKKQRGWINKLLRTYPEITTSEINIFVPSEKEKLLHLFHVWEKNKKMDKKDTIHEFTALKRLLDDSINFNIIVLGAFYKDILIGFSISELLHDKYAIMHFTKANVDYHGIYQLLYKETAKIHFKRGAIYLNREQDLGIESLRSAKLSWNPVTFLKKYIISEK